MLQILLTIIPLDLAATLSPGILALTLIILGAKKHTISSVFSFLLGNLITAALIVFMAYFLASISTSSKGPNVISVVLDLLFGLFFVVYGIRILLTKEDKFSFKNNSEGVFKWLIIGFIVSISNLDAVLLIFTATREVVSSQLAFIEKILLSALNVFFFVLPITLPLGLYLVFPQIASSFLTRLNKYVMKYSKYIISVMFLVFGIYFIFRALKHF